MPYIEPPTESVTSNIIIGDELLTQFQGDNTLLNVMKWWNCTNFKVLAFLSNDKVSCQQC